MRLLGGLLLILCILAVSVLTAYAAEPVPKTTDYAITFEGKGWTNRELNTITSAVSAVGKRLADILGTTPVEAFNQVYGQIRFYRQELKGYFAKAGNHKIIVAPGKATYALIIHELGHELDYILDNAPRQALCQEPVFDKDGRFITGCTRHGYNRNANRRAPKSGYLSDKFGPFLAHPRGMEDGNTASEDWADIFLNWVNQSFAANAAGDAIYTWAQTHLESWLISSS